MGKRTFTRRGASTIQAIGLGIGVLAIAGAALFPILSTLGGNPSGPGVEEQQQLVSEYVNENGFDAIVGDSPRKGGRRAHRPSL